MAKACTIHRLYPGSLQQVIMADPVNGAANPTEEDELVDYEEDQPEEAVQAKGTETVAKKGYVGIHSTGFKDFLLKPELLRSIVDCGFEHPSEGQFTETPAFRSGAFTQSSTRIRRSFKVDNLPCCARAVQHECIPQAILGMDVICQAKSGMGKTAVFVLSVLQQLEPVDKEVAALIICHTRELAYQVGLSLASCGF